MASEYQLIFKDAAGVKVAQVTDELELAYSKRRRRPGQLAFRLKGDHAAIATLVLDGQVEVQRRDLSNNVAWYTDFYGFFRGQDWQTGQVDVFTATCPGQLHLLSRRVIGYAAGVANRTAFTAAKAETIGKLLVQYNATSSGDASAGNTAGGFRARAASLSGFTITIEADGAHGNTLDWNCQGDNLLDNLEKLAQVAGGEFDLVKTGAATWDFRWFTGQRGTDRSATVIFSTDRGNMATPEYRYDRIDEKTAAIVGGQAQNTARAFVVRTGTNYAAGNDLEVFVDGRNDATTNALNAHGDTQLDTLRSRQAFGATVLQTPACRYGVHYCIGGVLGDLVKARYRSFSATQQIVGVDVAFKNSGGVVEKITPILMDA